jgi:hypothetical protein
MAFPTTSVLDAFNRSNTGPPPSGSWSTDQYGFGLPGLRVAGNACVCDGGFAAGWWSAESFPADQEAWVTVSTWVDEVEVHIRLQNPGTSGVDGYILNILASSNLWRIYRLDNQNTTLLASGAITMSSGDRIGISAVGSTLTAYQDHAGGGWTVLGSTTDATYNAAGYIGLFASSASTVFDDFGGGAVVTSIPTVLAGTLAASTDASSPYTVTPTLPAHQAGDILVVCAAKNDAATLTCGTSGWAAVTGAAAQSNANFSSAWFWKRAASGAETNPTVTSSSTGGTNAGIYATAFRIRGAATSGEPFEDATLNGSPTSSTTPAGSTVTTTGADRLVLAVAQVDDDPAPSSGFPPSGWDEVTSQRSTTGGDYSILAISKEAASAGDVAGATIATLPGADYWRTLTVAVLPVAVDTTPPVVDVTAGPTPARISAVSGFDESDFTFEVDEACDAWEVRAVGDSSDPRDTGDPLVLTGGAIAADTPVPATVTYADLDDAGVAGTDGTKILKVYARDAAGNWS